MPTHKIGSSVVLAAIYSRLTTDPLTSSYAVYNQPPANISFPYVVISDLISGKSFDWTSRDIKAEEHSIAIHVWSEYEGDKEASDMMDAIAQAITASDLSISGYTSLKCIVEFSEVLVDMETEGRYLRHGIIRFRVHIA